MNEKFISDNNNNNININNANEQDKLMKEVKKMFFFKIFILLSSLIRFFLMFILLFLIVYFPASFRPSFLNLFFVLYLVLISPIFTIFNVIVITTGIINRDFWIKIKLEKLNCYKMCCFCCIMSKNVTFLKRLTLTNATIITLWSFYFISLIIKDHAFPKNFTFFPHSYKRIIIRAILNCIDSLLLIGQWYSLHFIEFFLKRVNIYLEYYKRLIIKNRNKDATFVRDNLPAQIDDYLPSEGGTELQGV